jgi:hypothetical protein
VDFRVRAGGVRGDRAPLVDWWAAIVTDAARVGLNGPAKVDSLAKRAAWLEKQAAPSLALLWIAYGSDWLSGLLGSGEERLTEAQLLLAGVRRPLGGVP